MSDLIKFQLALKPDKDGYPTELASLNLTLSPDLAWELYRHVVGRVVEPSEPEEWSVKA